MQKREILVVEDNSDFRFLAELAFQKAQVESNVCFVQDGHEAIEYLKRAHAESDWRPQLMFLDVKLPKHDGFEVLEWVRNQPQMKQLPVVMFTCSDHPNDIARAYDLGANSYLLKPATFDGMVSLFRTLHHYWVELNKTVE